MDNNKINKSYLTEEAKSDINEMLGRGGESGGSSFTSQVETTGGLTLGKGTEDETSLTAAELKEIKDPSQLETSGGLTLGKDTEDETSVTAKELAQMKQGTENIVSVGGFSINEGNCVSLSSFSRSVIHFPLNNVEFIKKWMLSTGADCFYLVAPGIYSGLNTQKVRLTPIFNNEYNNEYFVTTKDQINYITGYSIICDNLTGDTVANYYTGSYLFVVAVKTLKYV